MTNYKPQSPLVMNGNGIFPLTTYDQIIMPDGSRWDGKSNSAGGAPDTLMEYTPLGGRDNFIDNLLLIDLNNPDAPCNQSSVIATEDASTLINSPITTGAFYAYREVMFIDNPTGGQPKCTVRLTQAYPHGGDIWVNVYDPNFGYWIGWENFKSSDNFAPAGYGLGQTIPRRVGSLDEITAAGYYAVWLDTANGDPMTGNAVFTAITDERYNNVHIQSKLGGGYIHRDKWDGVWQPWEWVNPPMAIGVEYRTTERVDGKPVYKKNIDGMIHYRLDGETEYKPLKESLSVNSLYDAKYCTTTEEVDGLLEADILKYSIVKDSATSLNNDGVLLTMGMTSPMWGAQLWLDDGSSAAGMAIRNKNANGWNDWARVLTESNWSNYIDVSGILSLITPSAIGAAPANHSHNYLPLTGGTLTGEINIQGASYPAFCLQPTTANSAGTYTGGFFEGSYFDNVSMWVWTDRTNSTKSRRGLVLHGHSAQSDDKKSLVLRSSNPNGEWQSDAYLLTDKNYSDYLSSNASATRTSLGLERARVMYEIDLSSYSTSNFYFIDFDIGDFELDCEIHSNNLGGDQPYNQNHIHFLMTYNGWSDTKKTFAVLSQGAYSETELTIMSIYAGTQNGLRGVYVRGGLTYRILSNVKPTLRTTTRTYGEESYASGTTSYTNVTNATQVWVNDGKTKASWSIPLYGAVWNDYAEYRNQIKEILPGYITYSEDDGILRITSERLQRFEGVVSDTFGFAIGETNECKTPIAVSGRVLVHANPEDEFHAGDCVCAGPGGLAYRMTRDEVIMYPDRIVGVVSEIPTYETWGTGNIEVNNRIWIKVK